MIRVTFCFLLLLSTTTTTTTEATTFSEKIYHGLSGSLACIRRLNETHQVGCGGGDNEYGVIRMISEGEPGRQESDLRAITEGGDSSEPTVVVISASQMSNRSLMMTLKSCCPRHLKGVLVLENDRPQAFSADRPCPNEYSSLYGDQCSQVKWNLAGTGLAFEDFPFPILLLRNESQIALLRKSIAHHGNNNRSYPKLAAQIDAQMFAAKNSVSCLRRSNHMAVFSLSETYCSAMGGRNLFYHTINLTTTPVIAPRSVVVLAARQDSFSLFDTPAMGADSAVSSMVVVLAIAEMLHRDPAIRASIAAAKKRSLMLALFDGEAFDYIGSGETAYRMLHRQFTMAKPRTDGLLLSKYATLQLNHISHFIELNQLLQYGGNGSRPHQLFLHKNVRAGSTPEIRNLLARILMEAAELPGLTVSEVDDGRPLPPSSAQSFLRAAQKDNSSSSNNSLNVLVVTNHRDRYLNRYYNSYLEDGAGGGGNDDLVSTELLAQRLTSIATLFGRVLYQLVTEVSLRSLHHTPKTLVANQSTVRQLLNCYLNDSNCELFRAAVRMKEPQIIGSLPPLSTYVSVIDGRNELRHLTLQVLRRFTGEKMATASNATECRQLKEGNVQDVQFSYQWITGDQLEGECLRSTAYNVSTVSPAYDEATGLAVEARLAEGYRLWTESRWTLVKVRLFLVPSSGQQAATVVAGLVTLAVSLLAVYLLDRDSDRLFAGEGNIDDLTSGITSCLTSSTATKGTAASSSSSSSFSASNNNNNIKGVNNVNENAAAVAKPASTAENC